MEFLIVWNGFSQKEIQKPAVVKGQQGQRDVDNGEKQKGQLLHYT